LNICSWLEFPNYSVFVSELLPVLYVSTFCLFTALLALFFILHLWYWCLLTLVALPLWKLCFFVTNWRYFASTFDKYTGYKLIWNTEMMCR
jgi:hypothetical protein